VTKIPVSISKLYFIVSIKKIFKVKRPKPHKIKQKRKKKKQEQMKKRSFRGARFCNYLINKHIKNVVWDLIEDPRETISTWIFRKKIFNQEEVFKVKNRDEEFFNALVELITTISPSKAQSK